MMLRLLALLGALVPGGLAAAQDSRLLDDFSAPSAWKADASDGVAASGTPFEGGLRLDYDFTRGSGYAFLRRELPLDLPENFEIRFRLRGGGPANALEIKLVDASGDNVWWHRKPDLVPPATWSTMRIKRRQIEFAWGPTGDRMLRRAAAIEFVVAAGSGGGKGWIAVDHLSIVPLPAPPAVPPIPIMTRDPDGAVNLDLGYQREFGGLVLQWEKGAHASAYAVGLSDDGRVWRTAREMRDGDGGTDWIRLEESAARFVRVRPAPRPGKPVQLAGIEVQPLAFGASDNGFITAVAKSEPRGSYPRGFLGEQNYWTLVATPAGGNSGLIDESGAIEAGRGGPSIEPFIIEQGRLASWADVAVSQSLSGGDLPIPSTLWRGPGWSLSTTAFAQDSSLLIARYALANTGTVPRDLTLMLALRPFQVNPPQQFLAARGGVSPLRRLAWAQGALTIDGQPRVRPFTPPDAVRLATFDAGASPRALLFANGAPIDDPTGLGSAAMLYDVHLAPGEIRHFALAIPLGRADLEPRTLEAPELSEQRGAEIWQQQLGKVSLTGPAAARPLFDTLRTALAHILMTREGPALRPGSRSYARSWIRDGAMMSTALLRLGHDQAAHDFLLWYAPYQYPSGKVPCCVDARGADPVPEHDSDGELIHLVAQLHRYAPDAARLALMWPRVRAAAGHIEMLRQSTRIATNRAGPTRHFHGLLPPSISHEGYSAKPMHSYWDDFWALAGLKDAAWLAGELGHSDEARLLHARADEFRADILASLAAAREIHGINFLPGAADLGDFDATSTTIALSPAGEQHRLPAPALESTFERYWTEFVARRDGAKKWDAYTPYEWRNVGAFVRLGWRERAIELADFFMSDRRPAAWNQWAEVVGREPREPRFVGDMPHGWVASDFINAALDMLAYERPSDRALVLAAGVPDSWLADGGIAVDRLRTSHGLLSYRLAKVDGRVTFRYTLDGTPPPGGIIFGPSPGRRMRGRSGGIGLP